MKSFEIGARKTHVFFLHGLRGHGLSQQAALRHMAKHLGVTVTSLELPGHGEDSIKQHCFVPYYQQIVDDICDEIQRLAFESEQVILMGYSFGASLMILAAHQLHQDAQFKPNVAGIIGISTAFDVGHNVPRWQLGLSNIIGGMSRFFYQRSSRFSSTLTIREMEISLISPDRHVQQSIADDPLVYKGRIPLATSNQVYRAGLVAKKTINSNPIPSLLLHSEDDTIALAPQPQQLAEHIQLKLFRKLRHNCIDGVFREAVVAREYMIRFISQKL